MGQQSITGHHTLTLSGKQAADIKARELYLKLACRQNPKTWSKEQGKKTDRVQNIRQTGVSKAVARNLINKCDNTLPVKLETQSPLKQWAVIKKQINNRCKHIILRRLWARRCMMVLGVAVHSRHVWRPVVGVLGLRLPVVSFGHTHPRGGSQPTFHCSPWSETRGKRRLLGLPSLLVYWLGNNSPRLCLQRPPTALWILPRLWI